MSLRKYPIAEDGFFNLYLTGLRAYRSRIEYPGGALTVFGVHTLPPPAKLTFDVRNTSLEHLANAVREISDSPVVVVGDQNVAPWSYYFQRLLTSAGLSDTRIGRGVNPTWEVDSWILATPIDHCLLGKNAKLKEFKVVEMPGSDHRAVLCRVGS